MTNEIHPECAALIAKCKEHRIPYVHTVLYELQERNGAIINSSWELYDMVKNQARHPQCTILRKDKLNDAQVWSQKLSA